MNDTMIDLDRYVDEVRSHLADLPEEAQDDLTDGLAADLTELVEERGVEALPRPEAYAAELRAAAGLAAATGRVRHERALPRAAMDAFDAAHAHWDKLLDALPGDLRGFLTAVQPVWWVVRAWVAWMVAQDARGTYVAIGDGPWLVVLGVLLIVSIQIGRRSWGFDRLLRASVLARFALVGLNIFAVTMLPGAVDRTASQVAENRAWMYVDHSTPAYDGGAITYQGRQSCALLVFNADGKRLHGIKVKDQSGRVLPMHIHDC